MKTTPEEQYLNTVFNSSNFNLWKVGGCVRDSLMGIEPADIDFATDATPNEQIALYIANGIKYKPTGLQHGTVMAIVNHEPFEITTLRTEANHDGRYADMTFTRSLPDDLGRRDLTVNAMAMDSEGNIIDPFGGQEDLRNGVVRFVNSPDDRMREDYLRILRWLRFHVRIAGDRPLDAETMAAASRQAAGLAKISRERVWSEISKMLTYPGAARLLTAMHEMGIAEYIGLPTGFSDAVQEASLNTRNPATLLAVYLNVHEANVVNDLANRWRWSNEDRALALTVHSHYREKSSYTQVEDAVVLGRQNKDYLVEMFLARNLVGNANSLRDWTPPSFPLDGNDFLQKGFRGTAIGDRMREIKTFWASTRFRAEREQLLDMV